MQDSNVTLIKDLGTVRGQSDPKHWHGAISLEKRIASGELSAQTVEESLSTLADYFVPTTDGAAKRCIDGSTIKDYNDSDDRWAKRPLGPQIQGGSADEACACHLGGILNGDSLLEDIDHLDDIRTSRFKPGDHTDDHADDTKTGCGAIDGQVRKLELLRDDESATVIETTVASIYELVGAAPPPNAFESLRTSAADMLGHTEYYSPPTAVLSKLRAINPDGVETLIRPHAEVSLTINFVPNTTFNRDHYNAKSKSKIQNFNLDAWNILEEYGERAYALVVDAVATAMDLTDGSLRVLVRMPKA